MNCQIVLESNHFAPEIEWYAAPSAISLHQSSNGVLTNGLDVQCMSAIASWKHASKSCFEFDFLVWFSKLVRKLQIWSLKSHYLTLKFMQRPWCHVKSWFVTLQFFKFLNFTSRCHSWAYTLLSSVDVIWLNVHVLNFFLCYSLIGCIRGSEIVQLNGVQAASLKHFWCLADPNCSQSFWDSIILSPCWFCAEEVAGFKHVHKCYYLIEGWTVLLSGSCFQVLFHYLWRVQLSDQGCLFDFGCHGDASWRCASPDVDAS